jgi:hypothetical protein
MRSVQSRRLAFILFLPLLLCLGAGLAAVVLRPRTFASHHDVIAYELGRRGIAFETISASLPWPDGVNYYAYGPSVYPYSLNVDIGLVSGRHIGGSLECRNDRRDCRLTLIDAGIVRQPVPDLTPSRQPDWMRHIVTVLDSLRALIS